MELVYNLSSRIEYSIQNLDRRTAIGIKRNTRNNENVIKTQVNNSGLFAR